MHEISDILKQDTSYAVCLHVFPVANGALFVKKVTKIRVWC